MISTALLKVIFPVILALRSVISVAVMSAPALSLKVIVPVLVVTVPAKASTVSETEPVRFAVGVARTIAPVVLSLMVFR